MTTTTTATSTTVDHRFYDEHTDGFNDKASDNVINALLYTLIGVVGMGVVAIAVVTYRRRQIKKISNEQRCAGTGPPKRHYDEPLAMHTDGTIPPHRPPPLPRSYQPQLPGDDAVEEDHYEEIEKKTRNSPRIGTTRSVLANKHTPTTTATPRTSGVIPGVVGGAHVPANRRPIPLPRHGKAQVYYTPAHTSETNRNVAGERYVNPSVSQTQRPLYGNIPNNIDNEYVAHVNNPKKNTNNIIGHVAPEKSNTTNQHDPTIDMVNDVAMQSNDEYSDIYDHLRVPSSRGAAVSTKEGGLVPMMYEPAIYDTVDQGTTQNRQGIARSVENTMYEVSEV